ncbi:glutathione-specific gamma-glutamylcyclotransferase 1 [Drosophila miranda]|uniref:glutathione-specific gamma-glutamylcyclotransferase 1 n=1 Tax=Drosophila miranda TaxID=7229 RepID=UPI0007E77C00|nr:glutathione-specific gamma-glutamylcyclotransferase 1 [Drosophila miranda]XP_017143526.1 glutathione-specific gamma-glutamylcyclotransferase 1 [Drosophila miranda]XP_017143527.1 glutathione-specific gamma-glutamylcyclotransferase 1 [Drosophila miranda]XP_033244494.1 glutathione-specific gamma-glutamylcyclotransferase 1 [Drosophila miranda]
MAHYSAHQQAAAGAVPAHFKDLFTSGRLGSAEQDNGNSRNNNNGRDDNNEQENRLNNANNNGQSEAECWVFGYGSLCWHPGFTFSKCITGYVRGFVRRFWQGNATHRGTEEKPGRVATLMKDKEGITWGCAYRVTGNTALEYLKQRECTLGGYATLEAKFFPRVASQDTPFSGEAVEVLVYVATPENQHWLGEAPLLEIAHQIATSRGPSGHNAEYLLRLAMFMHEEIPGVRDEHLFELERLVLDELYRQEIPMSSVMGRNPDRIRRDSHEDIRRQPSFEFTSRVPETKLRCLNI